METVKRLKIERELSEKISNLVKEIIECKSEILNNYIPVFEKLFKRIMRGDEKWIAILLDYYEYYLFRFINNNTIYTDLKSALSRKIIDIYSNMPCEFVQGICRCKIIKMLVSELSGYFTMKDREEPTENNVCQLDDEMEKYFTLNFDGKKDEFVKLLQKYKFFSYRN